MGIPGHQKLKRNLLVSRRLKSANGLAIWSTPLGNRPLTLFRNRGDWLNDDLRSASEYLRLRIPALVLAGVTDGLHSILTTAQEKRRWTGVVTTYLVGRINSAHA